MGGAPMLFAKNLPCDGVPARYQGVALLRDKLLHNLHNLILYQAYISQDNAKDNSSRL